ncbi:Smr/MutS family protein [Candidatus Pelagibacter bacterium]|nr:Smr/MutS family protein [Candidatus Pelagibacter bacterium]
MIKKKSLSKKDLETWNKYIKNPTDLVDKDNINKKKESKSHRFRYDLHGFSLLDANKKVEELIIFCVNKNYKEILLITGKGIHSKTDNDVYASKDLSKLKHSVPDYLKTNTDLSKYVSSISSASNLDGGEGAIIIKLKKL